MLGVGREAPARAAVGVWQVLKEEVHVEEAVDDDARLGAGVHAQQLEVPATELARVGAAIRDRVGLERVVLAR